MTKQAQDIEECNKKAKIECMSHQNRNAVNKRNMKDIIDLIDLSRSNSKTDIVTKYINFVSEFVLHKAKQICNLRGGKTVSANDIKETIISESLFFLSDVEALSNKQHD
ncbi:hypothetical protein CWI42_040360 [Ordospora colligata]|uniref:Transcription factor CBF/NF-Y/archaeal histone domain-containing protein n=1 Tax=Ordospora colligata OC4 TaxID=1354746 RepID=A0A0B2UKT8_9MICR|nr:uncharacterized protein M896_040360 [Ordospora colligata OC4]KHN69844.1 hypothetical protein M896_040360 [Ordospora colligata OC4]TBU16014.1 hypothetical protein CWI41_040360 [Ordospora colligata]TBU16227.1 hypothetical protein CWI40_040360 [Ordospora colligata]TBU18931.1 hypothetical protein CWI42_040360 [Ordospora colligata]